MRRGNLNKISYILIVISAIFTIISYVADQLVVRYENKLRINKFNYQNLDTEIKSLSFISKGLSNLEVESTVIVGRELRERNFWIKNLILFESEKKRFINHKKKIDIFMKEDFPIYNIKWRAEQSTIDLIDKLVEIRNSFKNIFNDNIFDNIDFFSIDEFNDVLSGNNWFKNNPEKFFNLKNWDDLTSLLSNTELNDKDLKDWADIRNFRLLATEILYNEIKKIEPVIKYLDNIIEDKEYDLEILFFETKKINSFKNYFILIGIISQILTLFFLLILFRYLIKEKVI
tara:strand:- start:347 stop:1207 length:861 start_codon:yes stop_codon:yes gene_type:complete